jgi:hypothetical protein
MSFILIVLISCNNKSKEQPKSVDQLLQDWKSDSLGNFKTRNDSIFKIISDSIPLTGRTYKNILSMFGNPDKYYSPNDSSIVILYYLVPHKYRAGTECYIRFDFENEILYSSLEPCP